MARSAPTPSSPPHLAGSCEVVEQATGGTVWGVHWTEESPGLREQLAHGGGAHLAEEGSPMHTAEVRQVTKEVQLVCNNSKTRLLWGGREGRGTPHSTLHWTWS